ncbi:hypothetical protein JCM11641_006196 [Rhodosporidiobolus odoratus]
MRLTLRPPASYPIPPILQSHDLPSPSLKPPATSLKTPTAYLNTKRLLAKVGLSLPYYLTADKALWWQFAVREVIWDLADEEVVVIFADGSKERWELAAEEDVKSAEMLGDTTAEDESSEGQGIGEGRSRKPPSGTAKVDPGHRRPWESSTVLARLLELSVELRSAYEDLGTATAQDPLAPDIAAESDWRELMLLAADPNRKIPFEWSDAKTLYEYAMEGVEEEDEDRTGPSQSTENPPSTAYRQPDPQAHHGQFRSRRRPRRLSRHGLPSKPADCSTRPSSPSPHDYLSLVNLLSRVRSYLADAFAQCIVCKLHDSLPPTYLLWAVDGAISYCKREAVKGSAEVAQMVLDLLEDDGEEQEASDTDRDLLEPDILVVESDSSSMDFDLDGGDGGSSHGVIIHESGYARDGEGRWSVWRDEEKRQKRLHDNPLASLKDDYQLRCWCEVAIERARDLARQEWLGTPGRPAWTKAIAPWPVSKSVEGDQSELDEATGSGNKRFRFPGIGLLRSVAPKTLSTAAPYASPPTSPPGGGNDLPGSLSRVPALEPSASTVDSETNSDETDFEELMDDPPSLSLRRFSPQFFFPEDLVGEKYLPPRLPKDVVVSRKGRGRMMEAAREELHTKLNQVAGLQKKLAELQDFAAEETAKWEEARESERSQSSSLCCEEGQQGFLLTYATSTRFLVAEKESLPPPPSGLRRPGASTTSPAVEFSKHDLPLKAQPLRKQTADRALSARLSNALDELEPSAKARTQALKRLKVRKSTPSSPEPRKRQRINLDAHSQVIALSRQKQTDVLGGTSGMKMKKRKRSVELNQASRKDAAEGADDEGPSRKRGKKDFKPMKRVGASASFGTAASTLGSRASSAISSASAGSSTGSSSAVASSLADDSRTRTVLELSNRRRSSLASAELSPALDWDDESEVHEEVEADIHIPWHEDEGEEKRNVSEGVDDEMKDTSGCAEDSEDEGNGPGKEDEAEMVSGPIWGTFPARTPQPLASTQDKFAPSPIPANPLASSPFIASRPSLQAFPTSSERNEPRPPDLDPRGGSASPPGYLSAPSSLLSPDPIRPFSLLDLEMSDEEEEEEEDVSPSPSPSSASGSSPRLQQSPSPQQGSLAAKLRHTLAVAGTSPASASPGPPPPSLSTSLKTNKPGEPPSCIAASSQTVGTILS